MKIRPTLLDWINLILMLLGLLPLFLYGSTAFSTIYVYPTHLENAWKGLEGYEQANAMITVLMKMHKGFLYRGGSGLGKVLIFQPVDPTSSPGTLTGLEEKGYLDQTKTLLIP